MNSQKPLVAPVTSPAIEAVDGVLVNLKGMIEAGDLDGMTECREELIQEVMSEAQRLASSWSMIDGPFAAQHSKDDHELVEMEFQALIARVVHLPDSVEGIRFLQRWQEKRLANLREVMTHAKAGTVVQMVHPDSGAEADSVTLTDDMAKGMRIGMVAALAMFEKFPINMEVSAHLERTDRAESGC